MSAGFDYLVYIDDRVAQALLSEKAVVALETAVATHGLPYPTNLEAIRRMEQEIVRVGAVPAICVAEDGRLCVGATVEQVERVAASRAVEKAAARDLCSILARRAPAGLTVSATLVAADKAGIRVFATGGIGGFHRGAEHTADVSSDLHELARRPVLTVCAGAKSVLDVPRTLEMLETLSVPVLALGTCKFPGFYLTSSGIDVPRLESIEVGVRIALSHWHLGLGGIVIGNPIPDSHAVSDHEWNEWLSEVEERFQGADVRGKDVTPFLLDAVAEVSGGRTVAANIALLANNARVGAEFAVALAQ